MSDKAPASQVYAVFKEYEAQLLVVVCENHDFTLRQQKLEQTKDILKTRLEVLGIAEFIDFDE